MKIGILITSVSNFGIQGFYNSQEIGLAKQLSELFEEIIIFKLIDQRQKEYTEKIENYKNVEIRFIPSKNMGINGIINTKKLDNKINIMIYFSDTQVMVPKIFKWCNKNDIKFIPYIGVVESHSESKLKKIAMRHVSKRNINVYKKTTCIAKTPLVQTKLMNLGVKKVYVGPVGLDLSLMKKKYNLVDTSMLKRKWNYSEEDKILLFIGRLTSEKRPLKIIEIFKSLKKKDNKYKLLIVGVGDLEEDIHSIIKKDRMQDSIKMIDKIPNIDIWELYRISDAFINLNKNEIFGMSILEAMFYECKVVAWKAPGPNFIINNKKSGYLVSNDEEIQIAIQTEKNSIKLEAHRRVIDEFTWKSTANLIYSLVK